MVAMPVAVAVAVAVAAVATVAVTVVAASLTSWDPSLAPRLSNVGPMAVATSAGSRVLPRRTLPK